MKTENFSENSFYKYLMDNGYLFDKYVVENFLLSLKVKPFIIFTGNSGTGKTKLSQLFSRFFKEYYYDDEDYLTIQVKSNFSSWSNQSWTLSPIFFERIFPIKESQITFNMNVEGIPAEGSLYPTIQLKYFSDELKNYFKEKFDENQDQDIDLKIEYDSLRNLRSDDYYIDSEHSIQLIQKSNKSSYEDRQWMANKAIYDHTPFKQGQIPCNIIVNGIKSSGEMRIIFKLSYKKNDVLQKYLKQNLGKEVKIIIDVDDWNFKDFKSDLDLEESDKKLDNNYQIVPVGANWTDNTNILGYYNVITEKYQPTPAYELINKAERNLNEPFFLILDEMNLSHVERYFADFLSAIESGEKIPLYGNKDPLKLSSNLFIIGTVNVDETTYMFSPKVLDRANTIEFDTISAWDYMSSKEDYEDFNGDINYLQSPLLDSNIFKLNIYDLKKILAEINWGKDCLWEILAKELTELQEILKGSGFDFGFRVINEILRFMVVAWRYENKPEEWDNWERYFDAQIKQKILPKLHGSEKAIGNVLTNLFNICLAERNNNENPKNFEVTKENSRYYTSALKLQNMAQVLSDQRYVSFIN